MDWNSSLPPFCFYNVDFFKRQIWLFCLEPFCFLEHGILSQVDYLCGVVKYGLTFSPLIWLGFPQSMWGIIFFQQINYSILWCIKDLGIQNFIGFISPRPHWLQWLPSKIFILSVVNIYDFTSGLHIFDFCCLKLQWSQARVVATSNDPSWQTRGGPVDLATFHWKFGVTGSSNCPSEPCLGNCKGTIFHVNNI